MDRKILITGAAGFLGSHLVDHHLSCGDYVYGIDNFFSSDKKSSHHRKLINNKNYNFIETDICNLSNLSKQYFDKIYNFACPASPPKYQSMPIETLLTCTVGTNNVISLAQPGTIVVHASTSEVYGDPNVSPQSEQYRGSVNSYGPRACYDEGKRAAEALCYDYKNKFDIDVRLVRIFNTYGPHMDMFDGRVITNFIQQALSNRILTVYGSGNQTRSFCYVTDLIKGIVSLGELDKNPLTPINLGNPTEFTILELAKKIQQKFDCEIAFKTLPTDDPQQRKPDITLARELLFWRPQVDLEEGLNKTIQYFEANY